MRMRRAGRAKRQSETRQREVGQKERIVAGDGDGAVCVAVAIDGVAVAVVANVGVGVDVVAAAGTLRSRRRLIVRRIT